MLYETLKSICWVLLHIIFRLKIIDRENEPTDGALIVCGKHTTLMDPVFIGIALNRQIHFMAKAELFKNNIFANFFRALGAFPVNRDRADLNAIKTSFRILKSRKVIGIFPEGKRVKADEKHINAKSGIAMIVYKTKTNVLPVSVSYKGKLRPFKRIIIQIGKVIKYEDIDFKDGSSEDFKRVSDDILNTIREI